VNLAATASDADGTVTKVEFYNGTTKLGEDLTAPYSFTWSGVAAGTYTLTARAVDNLGGAGASTASTITVNAANTPPTATLTSPADGTTFAAPATVNLAATASDPDGTVTKVEFFNGQQANKEVYVPASDAYEGFTYSPFGSFYYDQFTEALAAINAGEKTGSEAADDLQKALVDYAQEQGFTVTE
jgi:predicted phage tail protein